MANNSLIICSSAQFFAILSGAEQCFAATLAIPVIDGIIFPYQPHFAVILNADFSSARKLYAR
ncbi:MAG: hypothetical protein WCD24_01090 [Serratia inhibens]|uniref:hypothetical protein n=1 Tax=Serratia inhibens TaxID=2338073 RepID=UPI003C7C64F1